MKKSEKLQKEIGKLLFDRDQLDSLIQSKVNVWAKLNCYYKVGMKLHILYKGKYERIGIIKDIVGQIGSRYWCILVEGVLLTKSGNEDSYSGRFSFESENKKLYDHGEYTFIKADTMAAQDGMKKQ